MLEDEGHEVHVKLLRSVGTVDLSEIVIDSLVAADVDTEAALHPQKVLHQTVDVVIVGLTHLRRAVDEGVAGGHLAVGALHGDGHGLLRRGQEGAVEAQHGEKVGIQNGNVLHLIGNTKTVHRSPPSRMSTDTEFHSTFNGILSRKPPAVITQKYIKFVYYKKDPAGQSFRRGYCAFPPFCGMLAVSKPGAAPLPRARYYE